MKIYYLDERYTPSATTANEKDVEFFFACKDVSYLLFPTLVLQLEESFYNIMSNLSLSRFYQGTIDYIEP